ncbi:hypothetical protein D9M71_623260 [compost metagenome]
MMIQVGSAPFIQADRAIRVTLQPDVLTCSPERLQVLAVVVGHTIIEQVDHLLDVRQVPREPGLFDTLVTRTSLLDSVCR